MDAVFNWLQLSFISIAILLVVALGGLITERSGVTNIALEGIMIMGAFVGIFSISKFEVYPFNGIAKFFILLVTTSFGYFIWKWLYPKIKDKWIDKIIGKEDSFLKRHYVWTHRIFFTLLVFMVSIPLYIVMVSNPMPKQMI